MEVRPDCQKPESTLRGRALAAGAGRSALEALDLTGDEKVLGIGTGYRLQTAPLARLAHSVWSVEWFDDLADAAPFELEGELVRSHDGTEGLREEAPCSREGGEP